MAKATLAKGSRISGTQRTTLASQYAESIAIATLSPALGPIVSDLRIHPASGTYDVGITITLSPGLAAHQVRFRTNGGPWTTYAAPLYVYRDTDRYWELYQLAEKLVDLDDAMATWRHKHVLTVQRIIGGKRGTGGTAGVSYLQSTASKRAFPELWSLRTEL